MCSGTDSSNVSFEFGLFVVPSIPTSLVVLAAERSTHAPCWPNHPIPLCSDGTMSAFHQMKMIYITFCCGIWQTSGGFTIKIWMTEVLQRRLSFSQILSPLCNLCLSNWFLGHFPDQSLFCHEFGQMVRFAMQLWRSLCF